jgi:predicted kinase
MTKTDQIKYYRDSAATLRGIAVAVLDPEIRAELIATAAKFETLADWAEKRRQDSSDRTEKPQRC